MFRRPVENREGLLSCLLKLAGRHEDESQFRARIDVVRKQIPRCQKKRSRAQGSALLVPYRAQPLNRGRVARIGSKDVQVFDFRLFVVSRIEVTISSIQK